MADRERMRFIYKGSPTRITCGDCVVLDFGKQTVEFARDGATIGILPRHGRLTSSIEILPFDHGCAIVFMLILDICTGMDLEHGSSNNEERCVIRLSPRTATDAFAPSLMLNGNRTTFCPGDRVRIDWQKPSFTFSRGNEPLWIRNLNLDDDEPVRELVIEEPVPGGALLMTIWQSLELFTDMRVERVTRSDDEATFELMAP